MVKTRYIQGRITVSQNLPKKFWTIRIVVHKIAVLLIYSMTMKPHEIKFDTRLEFKNPEKWKFHTLEPILTFFGAIFIFFELRTGKRAKSCPCKRESKKNISDGSVPTYRTSDDI